MEIAKEEQLKRGEFLRSLGMSTASLMAFYCLGTTMTACGSKTDDPDPVDPGTGTGITGTTTGSSINFTIDLTNTNIAPKLVTGEKFLITGDVLVALTTAGTYVALSKSCTHQGTQLVYRIASNDLYCNNHLSIFTTTGAVQRGPETGDSITALKAYKTALSTDGKTLTVTA